MKNSKGKKVLLLGWDAADWKIINPLMDSGLMPALESLVNNGAKGNIVTLDPPMSPMLWTTIATGKFADKHGILGFTEPNVDNTKVVPVSVTSRKVKAIWNILTQMGLKTHLIGWWPSHPAEPINGNVVSNLFYNPAGYNKKGWPVPEGSIYPRDKEEIFKSLRVHITEITENHLLPFVPLAAKVDQDKDKGLFQIAQNIAQVSTLHAITTYIIENEEWDFIGFYSSAIDHMCHGFMNFHPPKLQSVPDDLYEIYNGVVKGIYIFHDMMLSRILELVDDDTTIMIVSDHGFHSDHLRVEESFNEPAAPAREHRDYGILVVKGPGIVKDELIFGASLLDVTPTLLTIYDFPVGKDMDGKPLVQIFREMPEVKYIDSWEELKGNDGMHKDLALRDPVAEYAAMKQLIELGYIEKPDEDSAIAVKKAVNENLFFLARTHITKRNFNEAKKILKTLFNENNDALRYGLYYLHTLQHIGDIKEARRVLEIITQKQGKNPRSNILRATDALLSEDYKSALKYLNEAVEAEPVQPRIHLDIALLYLQLDKLKEAGQSFEKAIELDKDNPSAYLGLAEVSFREGLYDDSADLALTAIGLLYYFPRAHIMLGKSLLKLGRIDEAEMAFQISLKMVPDNREAHSNLCYIYEILKKDSDKALFHRKILNKLNN